jgi:hypothetical protein
MVAAPAVRCTPSNHHLLTTTAAAAAAAVTSPPLHSVMPASSPWPTGSPRGLCCTA